MRRCLYRTMIGVLALTAWPAYGQDVDDARQIARTPWDDKKVTAAVVKLCDIPRIYIVVNREYDGYARLRESPSVTSEQHKCAIRIVEGRKIPIRK